jgi:HEPN domain-containing protein
MTKNLPEWFKQADYDMKTAKILLDNRRYIYAIFLCHLSVEKALKGLYQDKLQDIPPKVHNLVFLIEKIGLQLPEGLQDALFELNRVSIPTRYPEDLRKMARMYSRKRTENILERTKEALKWIKAQSSKPSNS